MADKYASWSDLLKKNRIGVDFELHIDNRVGARWLVAAPHGGGIEPGSTEIAQAVAGTDWGFYSVEGIKRVGNTALHITSHRFDEPELLKSAPLYERVVAVHGCDDDRPSDVFIWVGGGDQALSDRSIRHFSAAGIVARVDTFTPGAEPANLCNRGSGGGGVQLELSRAFRARLFESLNRAGRQRPTPHFRSLVALIRQFLQAA